MIIALIVFFVLVAGIYVAEGNHDASIERVQKTGDINLIEAWHRKDTIFHVFLNIAFAFGMFVFVPMLLGVAPMWLAGVIFGFMLLGFRQLFMVTSLNRFRNRKTFYIGNTAKFDKLIKGKEWIIFLIAALDIIGGMFYFYTLI